VIEEATAVATGDGKMHVTIPAELNGMNLVAVGAHVYTVSSSGTPEVQIHNLTDSADMLTTTLTIDASENDSKDATTSAVIDTDHDDVATGDVLRIDVDTAGTGTKGLEVRMSFRMP
jgi:O-glycosyl hydrolase